MYRFISICLLLLASEMALAQTTVTAVVTDPDSQTWNNGKWTFQFTPGGASNYTFNGAPVQKTFTGTLDGSGNLSAAIPPNGQIFPIGTSWTLTLCPNSSAPCQTLPSIGIAGSTQSLTSFITSSLNPIRFSAGPGAFGYADGEVAPMPSTGAQYFNVTSNLCRQWNGTAWQGCGSGSGASLPTNALVFGLSSTTSRAATSADVSNIFGSVPANDIFASPSGSAGTPSFRALGLADLPNTVLAAAGTPSSNIMTKWVTSNTIGNSSITDNGSTIATTEGLSAGALTSTGTQNGSATFTYNASAATAPSTNQFQISPAISITTPWSLSPAAAPPTVANSIMEVSTSGQQSFASPALASQQGNGQFYADTTGFDTAIENARAYANANNLGATVYLSQNGNYTTIGKDLTTTSGACIDIAGLDNSTFPGGQKAVLTYNGTAYTTAGTAEVLFHTATRSSFGCNLHDFNVSGGGISGTLLDTTGQYRLHVTNVVAMNPATSTSAPVTPIKVGSGVEYEQIFKSVVIGSGGSTNWATCVTPTGGATLTGCTSIGNSGGTGYQNPIAVVTGCTTIGTYTLTTTGTSPNLVITGFTPTGYSGCTTPFVSFPDALYNSPYAMDVEVTDSMFDDIRPLSVGVTAGIKFGKGANSSVHLHPQVGLPVGIEDHGGNWHYALECDTMLQFCISIPTGYNTYVDGLKLITNTALAGGGAVATGVQLFNFGVATGQGQNWIEGAACSGTAPSGGMPNIYTVNGTAFAVHNGAGLPGGEGFTLMNNCSNITTSSAPEVYGTKSYNTNQTFQGGIQLTSFTSATSGANVASPVINQCSHEWTGSVDQTSCFKFQTSISASGVPALHLVAIAPPTNELATTVGLKFPELKAAVSGTNSNSELAVFCSDYFNVSALEDCLGMNLQVGTGTTPTNVLHIGTHPIGALTGQTINMDLATTMSVPLAITSGGLGSATAYTSAQIPIAQTATDIEPRTMGGDATIATNGTLTVTKINAGALPVSAPIVGTNASGQIVAPVRCASNASPAACGADTVGFVAVPAAVAPATLVVQTTAVTATSVIQLTFDSSLGTALSVTCNTTLSQPTVSARTPGTSFTITMGTIAANPACISYTIN